ncbi:DUF5134 domain-containing protein [Streptomyces lavendulocolor]|uniref:DUF5134 domain-containing protein n=1 Tax=Streptomyces lavendulocolor TaxID=67316 RepID=UPI003C2DEA79
MSPVALRAREVPPPPWLPPPPCDRTHRTPRPPPSGRTPILCGHSLGGAGHHLHHLVGSLAMVYMAVAMSGGGAGAHGAHTAAGATAGGTPLVTGALLAYYTVYVLVTGLRLVPAGPVGPLVPVAGTGGGPGGGRWAGPEVALACRVSMGLAMLAMLVTV